METMVRIRSCVHHERAKVGYVNNDGMSPPVIYVEAIDGPAVISLTNQTIRISCPTCFEKIRSTAKYSL